MALLHRLGLLEQVIHKTASRCRTVCRHYSFLPSTYHLDDVWQKRLDSPLVKQIRLEQYHAELRKRFETDKSGSALDIDIFASAVQDPQDLVYLEELLAYLRSSRNTVQTLKSTCNAVVRAYLTAEKHEELMRLLANKAKYGMFLDHYTANLLMDKLISVKRISDAARVAIDLMFQEDFDNAVARELALYSCLSFLATPDWTTLLPLDRAPPPEDTGEEILVYIPFLKNDFFDDHFDLTDPKHRLGKTLLFAGRAKQDLLGRSCQIMGLALYEKWERGTVLLEKFATSGPDATIAATAVDSFVTSVQTLKSTVTAAGDLENLIARAQSAQAKLRADGKLVDVNLLEVSDGQVKETVRQTADAATEKQRQLYEDAEAHRTTEIGRQVRRFEIEERLRAITLKRQQLKSEEDMLFFFERKGQWEKLLTPQARQTMADQQAVDGSFYDYRLEDPRYEIPQIHMPGPYTPFAKWQRMQESYDEKLRIFKK